MAAVLVGASVSLLVAATTGRAAATHFVWRQDPGRPRNRAATAEQVQDRLRTVMDPEIQVNIVDLGLIRTVAVDGAGAARVVLTPTVPTCPATETLVRDIRKAVMADPGVATLDLTLDMKTPWSWERVKPEVRERIISGQGRAQ